MSKRTRVALVGWFADENTLIDKRYIWHPPLAGLFGFAKGLLVGLKYIYKKPFVFVKVEENGRLVLGYKVTSPGQVNPTYLSVKNDDFKF